MEHKEYVMQGTCSRKVEYDIENGRVYNVRFFGGCQGNLTGVAKLVEGMELSKVIATLEGIHCGPRATSCPDQLAQSLKNI